MNRSMSALVLCLVVTVSACDSGGGEGTKSGTASNESAISTRKEVTIESSLEGFAILPPRIPWTVTTSPPTEQIEEVRFIVDHNRIWADSDPPFSYGEAGAYLPTRWIGWRSPANRLHGFKVRVVSTNGQIWSETVRARVPKAKIARNSPGAFGDYFGYYGYGRLAAADLANPPPEERPSYTGNLKFDGPWLLVGRFVYEIISADEKSLRVGGPIFLGSHESGVRIMGGWRVKGFRCSPAVSPATYAWAKQRGRYLGSYNGHAQFARYLRLTALKEPCKARRRLLEGVWDEYRD